MNEKLKQEIEERKRAEQTLRKALNGLETVVEERTGAVVNAYKKLKMETEERSEAEGALQRAYDELEERTTELVKANERLKHEIEERHMVEAALRESEGKYKTLVESSLTGIFIHQGGKYVFVNDRFSEIHGYTSKELLGKEYLILLHPDERDVLAQIASARLKGEAVPQRYEVRRLAKNGKTIWCEMMATQIEYRGRPAIMGNVVDISQRKLAEEALQRSQQELRGLSSQLLHVQEDERKKISLELHDGIGQVLASVKIGLANAIGKIRQGMASASVESLEALMSVVQQAIQEVRRIYTDLWPSVLDDLGIVSTIFWFCREFEQIHLGIRIEKQIDIEEEQVPEALKIVIFRVLQEALTNVSKHAKANLVRVSMKGKPSKIELMIQDNGQGFDMEHARSANLPNRGFGLATLKERTELSGGAFSVQSMKRAGTTVRASWRC